MSLKFKIYKNSESLKDFMLDINLSNWMEYRRTLTSFKKSVNEYLTELVEQEKSADHDIIIDEEDSESSEDEKCSKRVSTSPSLFEKSKVPKM